MASNPDDDFHASYAVCQHQRDTAAPAITQNSPTSTDRGGRPISTSKKAFWGSRGVRLNRHLNKPGLGHDRPQVFRHQTGDPLALARLTQDVFVFRVREKPGFDQY